MYTWFLNFDSPPHGITYFIVSRHCLEISQNTFTELNRESYKYSLYSVSHMLTTHPLNWRAEYKKTRGLLYF